MGICFAFDALLKQIKLHTKVIKVSTFTKTKCLISYLKIFRIPFPSHKKNEEQRNFSLQSLLFPKQDNQNLQQSIS